MIIEFAGLMVLVCGAYMLGVRNGRKEAEWEITYALGDIRQAIVNTLEDSHEQLEKTLDATDATVVPRRGE